MKTPKVQLQTELEPEKCKVKKIAMDVTKDADMVDVFQGILENGYPVSLISNKAYSGINLYNLEPGHIYESQKRAFSEGVYAKGSTLLQVFFATRVEAKDTKDESKPGYCVLRYYKVVDMDELNVSPDDKEGMHDERRKNPDNLADTPEKALDLLQKLAETAVHYRKFDKQETFDAAIGECVKIAKAHFAPKKKAVKASDFMQAQGIQVVAA